MAQNQITLPVWGKAPIPIRAIQGEADSRTIIATLTDSGGQSIDLTSASVRLYIHKPDQTVVFMDGSVMDAAGGICSFMLPYQAAAAAGQASCEVCVTWSDNQTLKAAGLLLDILPSDLEGAAESTEEWPALTVALNKADSAASAASQAAQNAQQALSDAQSAVSSANAAASVANSAAISANNAADVANQAASDTAEKYRMVNPLTGQSDYCTNIIDDLTAYIFRDAVTAQQLDDLNKSAQDFDALAISAVNFDTNAKTLLGVA